MSSYGRNFDFRVPPRSENRQGRFTSSATALAGSGTGGGSAGTGRIPIGAPVVANTSAGLDALGNQIVQLPAQAAAPIGGMSGVAVYEYGPAAYAGFDPFLTTYSDLDTVPLGKAVQVVSGPYVKMLLINTTATTFLGVRSYPGRTMVNGLGASPTVAVGNYLVPGLGNDVDGYWQAQASATGAWAVITAVDTVRQSVEARFLF